jgi:hypothetical protein
VVVDWDDGEHMAASINHITAVGDQEFESMKAGPCLFVPCSDGENTVKATAMMMMMMLAATVLVPMVLAATVLTSLASIELP